MPCKTLCLGEDGFEDHENYETKKIHLRTHHDIDFEVNLYNSPNVTHFGCQNWEALCKMYGFYEGMIVTMDLGDPDIEQDNMDIWVLVDTLPIYRNVSFSNIVIN